MRLHFIAVSAFALFISGCLTPETPKTPAWVESPPAATKTELYGVSVSDTPAQAFLSATGGIAATILNDAEPRIKHLSSDTKMRQRIRTAAKAIMGELNYSDIVPKEQATLNQQTAVLVSIPRKTMARQLSSLLKQDEEQIRSSIENSKKHSMLERLGTMGKAYESLPRLLAEIALAEAVDPALESASGHALAEKIAHDYNAIKFGLNVTVISDAEGIVYVDTLYKALRAQGIVPGGKQIGTILIYADAQQQHTLNRYEVTMRVRFESTDGDISAAKAEHFLRASSKDSYTEAKKRSATLLAKQIEEKGLFHTLGF